MQRFINFNVQEPKNINISNVSNIPNNPNWRYVWYATKTEDIDWNNGNHNFYTVNNQTFKTVGENLIDICGYLVPEIQISNNCFAEFNFNVESPDYFYIHVLVIMKDEVGKEICCTYSIAVKVGNVEINCCNININDCIEINKINEYVNFSINGTGCENIKNVRIQSNSLTGGISVFGEPNQNDIIVPVANNNNSLEGNFAINSPLYPVLNINDKILRFSCLNDENIVTGFQEVKIYPISLNCEKFYNCNPRRLFKTNIPKTEICQSRELFDYPENHKFINTIEIPLDYLIQNFKLVPDETTLTIQKGIIFNFENNDEFKNKLNNTNWQVDNKNIAISVFSDGLENSIEIPIRTSSDQKLIINDKIDAHNLYNAVSGKYSLGFVYKITIKSTKNNNCTFSCYISENYYNELSIICGTCPTQIPSSCITCCETPDKFKIIRNDCGNISQQILYENDLLQNLDCCCDRFNPDYPFLVSNIQTEHFGEISLKCGEYFLDRPISETSAKLQLSNGEILNISSGTKFTIPTNYETKLEVKRCNNDELITEYFAYDEIPKETLSEKIEWVNDRIKNCNCSSNNILEIEENLCEPIRNINLYGCSGTYKSQCLNFDGNYSTETWKGGINGAIYKCDCLFDNTVSTIVELNLCDEFDCLQTQNTMNYICMDWSSEFNGYIRKECICTDNCCNQIGPECPDCEIPEVDKKHCLCEDGNWRYNINKNEDCPCDCTIPKPDCYVKETGLEYVVYEATSYPICWNEIVKTVPPKPTNPNNCTCSDYEFDCLSQRWECIPIIKDCIDTDCKDCKCINNKWELASNNCSKKTKPVCDCGEPVCITNDFDCRWECQTTKITKTCTDFCGNPYEIELCPDENCPTPPEIQCGGIKCCIDNELKECDGINCTCNESHLSNMCLTRRIVPCGGKCEDKFGCKNSQCSTQFDLPLNDNINWNDYFIKVNGISPCSVTENRCNIKMDGISNKLMETIGISYYVNSPEEYGTSQDLINQKIYSNPGSTAQYSDNGIKKYDFEYLSPITYNKFDFFDNTKINGEYVDEYNTLFETYWDFNGGIDVEECNFTCVKCKKYVEKFLTYLQDEVPEMNTILENFENNTPFIDFYNSTSISNNLKQFLSDKLEDYIKKTKELTETTSPSLDSYVPMDNPETNSTNKKYIDLCSELTCYVPKRKVIYYKTNYETDTNNFIRFANDTDGNEGITTELNNLNYVNVSDYNIDSLGNITIFQHFAEDTNSFCFDNNINIHYKVKLVNNIPTFQIFIDNELKYSNEVNRVFLVTTKRKTYPTCEDPTLSNETVLGSTNIKFEISANGIIYLNKSGQSYEKLSLFKWINDKNEFECDYNIAWIKLNFKPIENIDENYYNLGTDVINNGDIDTNVNPNTQFKHKPKDINSTFLHYTLVKDSIHNIGGLQHWKFNPLLVVNTFKNSCMPVRGCINNGGENITDDNLLTYNKLISLFVMGSDDDLNLPVENKEDAIILKVFKLQEQREYLLELRNLFVRYWKPFNRNFENCYCRYREDDVIFGFSLSGNYTIPSPVEKSCTAIDYWGWSKIDCGYKGYDTDCTNCVTTDLTCIKNVGHWENINYCNYNEHTTFSKCGLPCKWDECDSYNNCIKNIDIQGENCSTNNLPTSCGPNRSLHKNICASKRLNLKINACGCCPPTIGECTVYTVADRETWQNEIYSLDNCTLTVITEGKWVQNPDFNPDCIKFTEGLPEIPEKRTLLREENCPENCEGTRRIYRVESLVPSVLPQQYNCCDTPPIDYQEPPIISIETDDTSCFCEDCKDCTEIENNVTKPTKWGHEIGFIYKGTPEDDLLLLDPVPIEDGEPCCEWVEYCVPCTISPQENKGLSKYWRWTQKPPKPYSFDTITENTTSEITTEHLKEVSGMVETFDNQNCQQTLTETKKYETYKTTKTQTKQIITKTSYECLNNIWVKTVLPYSEKVIEIVEVSDIIDTRTENETTTNNLQTKEIVPCTDQYGNLCCGILNDINTVVFKTIMKCKDTILSESPCDNCNTSNNNDCFDFETNFPTYKLGIVYSNKVPKPSTLSQINITNDFQYEPNACTVWMVVCFKGVATIVNFKNSLPVYCKTCFDKCGNVHNQYTCDENVINGTTNYPSCQSLGLLDTPPRNPSTICQTCRCTDVSIGWECTDNTLTKEVVSGLNECGRQCYKTVTYCNGLVISSSEKTCPPC